jgi:hypothetical protein
MGGGDPPPTARSCFIGNRAPASFDPAQIRCATGGSHVISGVIMLRLDLKLAAAAVALVGLLACWQVAALG